jgi:hypothetical protein
MKVIERPCRAPAVHLGLQGGSLHAIAVVENQALEIDTSADETDMANTIRKIRENCMALTPCPIRYPAQVGARPLEFKPLYHASRCLCVKHVTHGAVSGDLEKKPAR